MGAWGNLVTDPDSGWQEISVNRGKKRGPHGFGEWAAWLIKNLGRGAAFVIIFLTGFVVTNWLVTALAIPAVWLWAAGLPWLALGVLVAASSGIGAWFVLAAESFDVRVVSPFRKWRRRRRYRAKWVDLMVGCRLVVKDKKRRELAPKIVRIKQGRFADVLVIKLPSAMSSERFTERLGEITEDLHAREARILPASRRRVPAWLGDRLAKEFRPGEYRAGFVYLRLAFGDPLAHLVSVEEVSEVDFSAVKIGKRDDGKDWLLSLLGTHILLAGATGSGKGSVLWSLLGSIGPAIRDGLVQVVGIDPKGGMELGFGRELFRGLLTMDGQTGETEAVEFLEGLAEEADRRAGMLAGRARKLEPSTSFPFLVIVIDELASVTAFLSDSKLRQRADSALGRLLTKGRAPGMCVIGALQDPRKEVVKWRDLFPTRVALRLVEGSQVDLALGEGARSRGAKCDHIPESAPGVGYVVEDGSRAVTRVRAAYFTDEDIRRLAETYRPGPVVAQGLHSVEGDNAA